MDSIERPRGMIARDRSLLRPWHGGLPALRLSSWRGWLMIGALAVTFVLAGLQTMGSRPSAVTVDDLPGGPAVGSVGIGSPWWIGGVRIGARGEWQAVNGVEQHSFAIQQPGGRTIIIPMSLPALDAGAVLVASALGLGALTLRVLRLPAAAPLAAAAAGIAVLPIQQEVGLPAALPLIVLPALVAIFAVRMPDARRQRAFDLTGGLVVLAILFAGTTFSTTVRSSDWAVVWLLPLLVGVGLAAAGELVALMARLRALPPGERRLLTAAVPLAADSLLAGADEERSRMAIELHNLVLPQVETSLRALRESDSIEAAGGRLETLAGDLRDVMQREQTVTLELGGVAEALRSSWEAIRPAGVAVRFGVSGNTNRPPRRVELAAYRIGQAAIDNATRHSGADLITVSMASAADSFALTVADDGVGLDDIAEHAARRRGRIGLAQMRLRAESVGGTLDVDSTPGNGTSVRFRWTT